MTGKEFIVANGRPKKVLWLSRHSPWERQWTELRRVFGPEVIVHEDARQFGQNAAQDIRSRMQSGQFDEIVLVAPTSILDDLVRMGVNPIWPRMSRDRRTFLGFDRILAVRKTKGEVASEIEGHKKIMWLSRFAPAGRQVAGLQSLFGDDVVIDHRDIPNVEEAADEFQGGGYRAIVAIVPEAVCERLSALELPLLRSEAIKENDPAKIEFRGAGGQGFCFDRYVWYSIEVESERL